VRNGYTLKLMNHALFARKLVLSVEAVKGATLNAIGIGKAQEVTVPVEADRVHSLRVLVTIERKNIHAKSMDMEFVLTDPRTGESREVETVFLSGGP
jgi:polyferredoxin